MLNKLPMRIDFHAIAESWMIYYEPCKTKFKLIERPHYEIVLIGSAEEANKGKVELVTWIKNKAKNHLIKQLTAISHQTQLLYNQVKIRDQQTIWGSCTSKKSISLNYKLLFLPKPLLNYVIIHELCHTKHLNHSKKFWHLVSLFDPEWQNNRRELRVSANQFIPDFV